MGERRRNKGEEEEGRKRESMSRLDSTCTVCVYDKNVKVYALCWSSKAQNKASDMILLLGHWTLKTTTKLQQGRKRGEGGGERREGRRLKSRWKRWECCL